MIASFLLVKHLVPRARFLPLVPPALLAGSWPLAINTMTGLETVFFAALITTATWLLIREQDDLRHRGSSVEYALAALTRPEAIGLSLLTITLVAFHQRRGGKPARDYLLRLTLPFLGIVGAHELFRLAYYGDFFPTPFLPSSASIFPWECPHAVPI